MLYKFLFEKCVLVVKKKEGIFKTCSESNIIHSILNENYKHYKNFFDFLVYDNATYFITFKRIILFLFFHFISNFYFFSL